MVEFVPELGLDATLVSDKVLVLYTALVLGLDTSTEVPSKVIICVRVTAELAVFTAIAPSLFGQDWRHCYLS